ncbi:dolichyl-phosphate beta-glucosyltransferase isoform X2 [Syngnathoides biaculeatus]|uniref:dolichyl-phosphate beta-glucosyltransferase isoform X2 n=1 Tax=Syngnathoides biaculeatus TaxID=300417 RepID=UPI002ADD9EAB|nr:dolichyl-phosphate beta-glucosyltransferase isoform X2 [Syngnathoides biaculeatus]
MDWICEILEALLMLAIVAVIVFVTVAYVTASEVNLTRANKEKCFLTTAGNTEPFPSLHDPPSIELSVVVPAYNEELRLPVMLNEAMAYLENRERGNAAFTYEVIVVDDGSKDKTTEVALRYTKKYSAEKVRVLTLVKNRGKGGAVRMGTLSSRGRLILMADADGATKFADVEKVEAGLKALNLKKGNLGISCGSRAHLEQEALAQRSFFRNILMRGFHFLVWFLCVRGVRDTQCGFKVFTREAALRTFSSLHVERWAFDVELLFIAQCLKIPIAEVAVNWTEIEGLQKKMGPWTCHIDADKCKGDKTSKSRLLSVTHSAIEMGN